MGFEVVSGELATIWARLGFDNSAQTVYQGSLLTGFGPSAALKSGLRIMGAASGAVDTSNQGVPFGVCLGFNYEGTYSSTYKGTYVTTAGTLAAQAARTAPRTRFIEGKYPKNDPAYYAHVAVIGPNTILKGRIFNAAYGTAPTVYACSNTDATGAAVTTSALTQATIAYNSEFFCRTGANKGISRASYAASTTTHTFYDCFPKGIVAGDTFCPVAAHVGTCYAQFDAAGTYIEQMPDLASNYYALDVLELSLDKAGEEYAIFKFNIDQFAVVRA